MIYSHVSVKITCNKKHLIYFKYIINSCLLWKTLTYLSPFLTLLNMTRVLAGRGTLGNLWPFLVPTFFAGLGLFIFWPRINTGEEVGLPAVRRGPSYV